MTATLTITLGDEILKALKEEKSITVALNSGGGNAAPAPRTVPRTRSSRATGPAKANTSTFRAGSLPAKLVAWAAGRKRPFGVPDVMKALKIKRSHASMLLTAVMRKGGVKRVGRGEYSAG